MERFADKVVLITGAASGIGRATAERLASEGAALALGALIFGAPAQWAACGSAPPALYLNVEFAAPAPPAAQQVLVRRNLEALFAQATGLRAASAPVPDLPRLNLRWRAEGERVVLEARPERAEGPEAGSLRWPLR